MKFKVVTKLAGLVCGGRQDGRATHTRLIVLKEMGMLLDETDDIVVLRYGRLETAFPIGGNDELVARDVPSVAVNPASKARTATFWGEFTPGLA